MESRGRGRGRGTISNDSADASRANSPYVGGDEMARLESASGRQSESRTHSSQGSCAGAEGELSGVRSPAMITFRPIDTLAKRPGFGTVGFPIPLKTNFVLIKMNTELVMHHYSVAVFDGHDRMVINSERCRSAFWRAVRDNRDMFSDHSRMVYDDGKMLVTLDPIALGRPLSVTLDLYKPIRDTNTIPMIDFRVRINEVGALNLKFGETDAQSRLSMQFLDALITQRVRCPYEEISQQFYPFKQSIYSIPSPNAPWVNWSKDIGSGMEAWTGLYSAIKVCQKQLMLNADVSTKVFYKVDMPLIKYYLEVVNSFKGAVPVNARNMITMNMQQRSQLKEALTGLDLKYPFTGSHMRFVAVCQPSNVQRFTLVRDNVEREYTVEEYFRVYKGVRLEYPALPTIHCGPTNRNIYIPMELLNLSDRVQRVKKRLSDFQLSQLIRGTALDPSTRFDRIGTMLQTLNAAREDSFLQAFQVEMDNRFVELNGRKLPSPRVELHDGFSIPVKDGVWPLENRVTEAPRKVIFGVVCVNGAINERELREPFNLLMTACQLFGMEFALPYENTTPADEVFKDEWKTNDGDARSLDPILNSFSKNVRADCPDCPEVKPLLIFISARPDAGIYGGIKVACDRIAGIASQVVLKQTLMKIKGNPQRCAVAHNLFLKINAKLEGVNNRVTHDSLGWNKFTNVNDATLFIGIDVTHPSPAGQNRGAGANLLEASIAAVVGSDDIQATRYSCSLKLQDPGQERIFYMVDVLRERIMSFYKNTNITPAHIVVFRDGISNSEFIETMNEELAHLRTAMDKLSTNYSPTVSYVVVQKRHHTRFYAERDQDARGRQRNVPPGTVVDDVITSPNMFDFYLCSHLGAIGTSRPAHYTVLYDTWKLSADEWQQMAFALCHLYVRCARSVSIPAPVYYAHLACTRARFYVHEAMARRSSENSGPVNYDNAVVVHENAPNMYFV